MICFEYFINIRAYLRYTMAFFGLLFCLMSILMLGRSVPPPSEFRKFVSSIDGKTTCNGCHKPISSQISNIKSHILSAHPNVFADLQEAAKARKRKKLGDFHSQTTNPKQAQDQRIASLLAKPTIPLSLFADSVFKNFISNYDERYDVGFKNNALKIST